MYWYYFQSARGKRVSWKEWITRLQIAQFVLDLGNLFVYLLYLMRALTFFTGFVYFASWDYFISTYAPHLPHMGTCAGEPYAAVAGDVILSSYLVLFISFYIATYKKTERNKASMKAAAKKAEIQPENEGVTAVKATGRAKRGVKSANKAQHRLGSSRQSFS